MVKCTFNFAFLFVQGATSIGLDSQRNEGVNKPEPVLQPTERTKNARWTVHNLLNWIRSVNGMGDY